MINEIGVIKTGASLAEPAKGTPRPEEVNKNSVAHVSERKKRQRKLQRKARQITRHNRKHRSK